MVLYKSFATTFIGFAAGEIKQSQLEYGSFDFNCGREKIICSPNAVPLEVSWAQTSKHKKEGYAFITNEQSVDRERIHPEVIKVWDKFQTIIETAEKQGRVDWKKEQR